MFDSGIRPTIDSYLDEQRAKIRDYGDYWSASSAGYCMRKNMFERLGVPHVEKEDDARKTRVFEAGHIFHEWVQRITKNAGLSIAQELELQDEELMIRGHVDDLVLVGGWRSVSGAEGKVVNSEVVDRKLILYDYKTAHSRSFHYSKDRPVSHYHKMQVGTYMYMVRKYGEELFDKDFDYAQLKEARILSISKDDLCMQEKQVLWDAQLEKEVLDYWTTLNRFWAEKKLPKCTCAEQEGGFMAQPKYNPYYFAGEPCSLEWYKLKKKEGVVS